MRVIRGAGGARRPLLKVGVGLQKRGAPDRGGCCIFWARSQFPWGMRLKCVVDAIDKGTVSTGG